jgi:hypothetical protein
LTQRKTKKRINNKFPIMQQLELVQIGLAPLEEQELQETEGGAWPKWLKGVTWVSVGSEIIENWEDVKKGVVDGWNSIK